VGWYSERLNEWHYGLTMGGLLVMVTDLVLAGLFQGSTWMALKIWEDSVRVSLPFWYIRLVAGLVIIAGQVCFFVNIYRTWQASRRVGERTESLAVV
jgi:cbb3-type cytochrome oxidase subunit 1